jgi:chaperone protein EcpD
MKISSIQALLAASTLAFCHSAVAGVVLNGTRFIYPAEAREMTVQVENVGDAPALVQAWIDTGDADKGPDDSEAPFVVTPPVSRVDPKRSQALRVMFSGSPLPQDRESVFWLNVLDVPPAPDAASGGPESFLQVAFRSRVKLFYRPANLEGTANQAPATLRWTREGGQLRVVNPSPYHVTLVEVHVVENGVERQAEDTATMLAPLQGKSFTGATSADKVRFSTINDYGGSVEHAASIGPGK